MLFSCFQICSTTSSHCTIFTRILPDGVCQFANQFYCIIIITIHGGDWSFYCIIDDSVLVHAGTFPIISNSKWLLQYSSSRHSSDRMTTSIRFNYGIQSSSVTFYLDYKRNHCLQYQLKFVPCDSNSTISSVRSSENLQNSENTAESVFIDVFMQRLLTRHIYSTTNNSFEISPKDSRVSPIFSIYFDASECKASQKSFLPERNLHGLPPNGPLLFVWHRS